MNLVKARLLCIKTVSSSLNVTNAVKTQEKYVVGFAEDDRTFQPNATLEVHIDLDLGSKVPISYCRYYRPDNDFNGSLPAYVQGQSYSIKN